MTSTTPANYLDMKPANTLLDDDDDDFRYVVGPPEIQPHWIEDEGRLNTLEMEVRYQWAKDVQHLHERWPYFGVNAAVNLSEVFSRGDHDIEQYYRVAIYVNQDLFDALINHNRSRAGRTGYMTWSHVTQFARTADPGLQQELLGLCLANQWSASKLSDEIFERDERLWSKAIAMRSPSLKIMVARVTEATSTLVDESIALHRCPFRRWIDKLIKGTKTTSKTLHAARQSVAASIERLQVVLVVLERAEAIIAAKPSRRHTQPAGSENIAKIPLTPGENESPEAALADRSAASGREDLDVATPAPTSLPPPRKRRLTRRLRRRVPKQP